MPTWQGVWESKEYGLEDRIKENVGSGKAYRILECFWDGLGHGQSWCCNSWLLSFFPAFSISCLFMLCVFTIFFINPFIFNINISSYQYSVHVTVTECISMPSVHEAKNRGSKSRIKSIQAIMAPKLPK